MQILIIGSKGFIGSYCLTYYRNKGHLVFGCDVAVDYIDGMYFLVDATNANYQEVFKSQHFDVCINCSGAANVQDSIKNPQRDFQLNTTNVFLMLDAIRLLNSSCKFINLSSAAVYGHPKTLPIKEKQELNPISPYGFHKKYAEEICKQFYQQFQISTCSLRIFSAYGPGLRKQLFWDLFKKADKNNVIELFGSGKETRDFIYIDDLVSVIENVIQNAKFRGESINVASGIELSIREVSETFASHFKNKSVVFNDVTKIGDPNNWVADISILKSFGFKPRVDLKNGLNNYIEWIKKEKL